MQAYSLVPHQAHPPDAVTSVEAKIGVANEHWLTARWRIEGSAKLVLPKPAGSKRMVGLWQTTCFELFVQPDGRGGYYELNLSPSERWNLYGFDAPRTGMREEVTDRRPVCTMRPGSRFAIFDAAIPRAMFPDAKSDLGIAAVIEEEGGTKSFWALDHAGEAPDFHDPACFTARLDPRLPS